jgi:hypothetical protein
MEIFSIHNSDMVFKRVLLEEYPSLSSRQINKMMYAKGYKLCKISKLAKSIKKLYDLEGLHGNVKIYLKKH